MAVSKIKQIKLNTYTAPTDLNTIKDNGIYALQQNLTNVPSGVTWEFDWSIMFVMTNKEQRQGGQLVITRASTIFFRALNQGSWQTWRQIDLV